jgi:hypothetical protein
MVKLRVKSKTSKAKTKQRNPYFSNNEGIRNNGIKLKLTQWQKDEIEKCRDDMLYFIRNYCYIYDLDEGLILFEPRSYQLELLNAIIDNRMCIANYPRRAGKTSIVVAYCIHQMIFNEFFVARAYADGDENATTFTDMAQTMYAELPYWFQLGVTAWNNHGFSIENGSSIYAKCTTPRSGRSKAISFLYLDECVAGETKIQIRDKKTKEVKEVEIKELYNELKTKTEEIEKSNVYDKKKLKDKLDEVAFRSVGIDGNFTNINNIRRYDAKLFESIIFYTKDFLGFNLKEHDLCERIYCIYNDIEKLQTCAICGELVEFINYKLGYKKTCSKECRFKNASNILKEEVEFKYDDRKIYTLKELKKYIEENIIGQNEKINPNYTNIRNIINNGMEKYLNSLIYHTEKYYGKNTENLIARIGIVVNEVSPSYICKYCGKEIKLAIRFQSVYNYRYIDYCVKECSGNKYNESKCWQLHLKALSQSNIGRKQSKEWVESRISKIRGFKKSKAVLNRRQKWLYETKDGERYRNKIGKKARNNWKNPEYRNKVINGLKDTLRDKKKDTMPITNSWTHFDTVINGKPFRSSFEGIYYLYHSIFKNNNVEYEKIRLDYYFESKRKIYVVDFINHSTKELVEIKPSTKINEYINTFKFRSARLYAVRNNLVWKIIDENVIYEMYKEMKDNNFSHEFLDIFGEKYGKHLS